MSDWTGDQCLYAKTSRSSAVSGNLKFLEIRNFEFLKFGLSRRASSNASAAARVLDFWHLSDFRLPSPFAGDGARTKKSWFGRRTAVLWRSAVGPAQDYINSSLFSAPLRSSIRTGWPAHNAQVQLPALLLGAEPRRPPRGEVAGRAVCKPRPPEGESPQSNC